MVAADGHRLVTRGMPALTRALRRASRGRRRKVRANKRPREKVRKKRQSLGRENTVRGTVCLGEGTAEEAEKGELSSAAEFLRRATQGETEVNPHQRSSRQLKIPLAIFMTVSSTGEATTA